MADDLAGLTPQQEDRIQKALDWIDLNGNQAARPPAQGNMQPQPSYYPPLACVLMQDLHSGGVALAQVLRYQEQATAWTINVLGVNPVPESAFKIEFSELTIDAGGIPTSRILFETEAISVVTTAEEMQAAIVAASNGVFRPGEVIVEIGNPFSSDLLITEPEDLHGDVIPADDDNPNPRTLVGSWSVSVTYRGEGIPELSVFEDAENGVYMRGLSVISAHKTEDVPSGDYIQVRDRFHLAEQSPARAGVIISALWYSNAGYCVNTIGHRDMTVSQEDLAEFEDEEEEEEE